MFATQADNIEDPIPTCHDLEKPGELEKVPADSFEGHEYWMDIFPKEDSSLFSMSSAAMMAEITDNATNKTAEDQLKEIQDMASKIQSEMVNLLTYALSGCKKEDALNDNTLRKKRETPMDSAKMVMRLLNHIKSNNENQNIAIEKMMSAQEIADKFGIPFNPDPSVLTDFVVAASEQAKDLTSILTETSYDKNTIEQVQFVPLENESTGKITDDAYYVYAVNHPENMYTQLPPYEYRPEHIHRPKFENVHYYPSYETQVPPHHVPTTQAPSHYYPQTTQAPPHHYPQTTQAPPHHYPQTTPKPTFYDSFMPEYYQPYCPVPPATTMPTIILPFEEVIEPEPELVGEEYEETVSTKVTVDHNESGYSTVNHETTYTLSEKAHFKTPEIQQLPQQMQYTFFLM